MGYGHGCTDFGDLRVGDSTSTGTIGYHVTGGLGGSAYHHDGGIEINDGPLTGYSVTGVVVVAVASDVGIDGEEGDSVGVVLSVERYAVTDVEDASALRFDDLSFEAGQPRCTGVDSESGCYGEIGVTFVVVMDDVMTGLRAYQFLRPSVTLHDDAQHCPVVEGHPAAFGQRLWAGLAVYRPLLEIHASSANVVPDPESWPAWIDEVLPRPTS